MKVRGMFNKARLLIGFMPTFTQTDFSHREKHFQIPTFLSTAFVSFSHFFSVFVCIFLLSCFSSTSCRLHLHVLSVPSL